MKCSSAKVGCRSSRLQRGRSRVAAAIAVVLSAGWQSGLVSADVPDAQIPEVEHLLEYIRTSPCLFMRNGREYPGERAYKHVLRKYNYFRDRIETTEQFIELSASVSTISGEPYWFVCDGEPRQESQKMLLEELERYRTAGR